MKLAVVREQAVRRAKAARGEIVFLLPLAVMLFYIQSQKVELFGSSLLVHLLLIGACLLVSYRLIRDLGRVLEGLLSRRFDPNQVGTTIFVLRVGLLLGLIYLIGKIVGIHPQALFVGGAATAIVLGIAAQQTLANFIGGIVILFAHPFKIGDRIRLHAGGLAGAIDGTVENLGLLYLSLRNGEDRVLIPNNIAIQGAVFPLSEPDSLDFLMHCDSSFEPQKLEEKLQSTITVSLLNPPSISVVEVRPNQTVLRVRAVPAHHRDAATLSKQVLSVVHSSLGSKEAPTLTHALPNM